MPSRGAISDLLEYNEVHRVLICRQCRYAIQKSAVPGHLLRHKVYRDDRRQLLSSIAELDVPEPQDVIPPSPGSSPINPLPVIAGFSCTATDNCGKLCASEKRARRHLSEAHGIASKELNGLSCLTRRVKMQTFFRGTKIRYFEVSSHSPVTPCDEYIGEYDDVNGITREPLASTQREHHSPALHCSLMTIDLETMTYFHHFTTNTSLTLPNGVQEQPGPYYWQTTVVLLALQHRWLVCGLLAISARHLASHMKDPALERIHMERASLYLSEFSAGWENLASESRGNTSTQSARITSSENLEQAMRAGTKTMCILRLTDHSFSEGVPGSSNSGYISTKQVMAEVRKLGCSFSSGCEDRSAEVLAQAKRILDARLSSSSSSDPEILQDIHPINSHMGVPSSSTATIFHRLSNLPYRMADALGKPDDIQEVLAAMLSIANLVICYDASLGDSTSAYRPDESTRAWNGMAAWVAGSSEIFNDMVTRHNAGALVILAHWVMFQVTRAEDSGCWFLRGLARKMYEEIVQQLAEENYAVQRLVLELGIT